jgi:Polyketide cyclase / dehydrase and lipid transport
MARAEKSSGPMDRLRNEAGGLLDALADRATSAVRNKVQDATGRLTGYVEGGGGPGLMAAVTGAKSAAEGKSPGRSMLSAGFAGVKEKVKGLFGGKGGGGGKQKLKLTNIVESVDVGVPVRLAYNQWTQFEDFPTFTKKVEQARPDEDDQKLKVNWKAQVFWSHREWEATITDQRPDERIIWTSTGQKGHVNGAVTFHELGPNLTKIVVVLEYHPQGMFERTGNLWRAQGRRTRLELKHFQRHVMAHALLNPDEIEGWRGTIEDGEIVKDHETALQEEQERSDGQPADELDDQDRAEDEGREDELEGRDDERETVDDEAEAPEDEAPEDEAPEDEAEPSENGDRERSAGRRRSAAAGNGGRGRRPAAARAGRSEERPQRAARRGATQGRSR